MKTKTKQETASGPKYPNIKVKLSGNAFAVMGQVNDALRRGLVSKAERDEFFKEATDSTYDIVVATATKWVTVS